MLNKTSESQFLSLHIIPNAPKSAVVGRHGSAIKIKLHAPAVDNKANAELLRFLGAQLGLSQSDIKIVRGQKSREKIVSVSVGSAKAEAVLLSSLKE